jgi:hypothetical protein
MQVNIAITSKNGSTVNVNAELTLEEIREFHSQALEWFERREETLEYISDVFDLALSKAHKALWEKHEIKRQMEAAASK